MSIRTRITGPIRHQGVGSTEQLLNGEGRWISIDVNDGWTLYDPNSTIVSVSTSDAGMRIVSDNASNSERWSASAQGSGRWWKKLIGPFGPLTWQDKFTLEIIIELDTLHANTALVDRHGVVVGLADSDIESQTGAINWVGMASFLRYVGPAGLQGVIGGDTGTTNGQNASAIKQYAIISPPIDDSDVDNNPSTRRTMMFLLDSNDDLRLTVQSAEQTHEYTETDDVYLFVASSYGATIAGIDDPDATWKIWYRVNLAPDGLSPTYIPKSGTSS